MSTGDIAAGGSAFLLIVDLLFLPWLSAGALSATATSVPDGWPAVLAIVFSLVLIVDLVSERFAPLVVVPSLGGKRTLTRLWLGATTMIFFLLKFVLVWSLFQFGLFSHLGVLGVGFWAGMVLVAGLVVASLR